MSDIEALLIRHDLTVFHPAPQNPEIHGPAITRDAPVVVLQGPPHVVEVRAGCSVLVLQAESDARARPVSVSAGNLEFELGVLLVSCDSRTPVKLRPKPQLVLCALFGLAG